MTGVSPRGVRGATVQDALQRRPLLIVHHAEAAMGAEGSIAGVNPAPASRYRSPLP